MQCFRPVDVAGFLFALDRVTFAASNDESRFNLNGVLIENEYHWSKLTATDGHRLAQARCPALWKDKSKMIVPKLGVLTAMSLFRKAKELKTSVDDKNLCLQSEDVRLMIRLIDGDYPDYRKVIPAPEPAAFVVERQAWLNALTALEPFTGERNKGVQFMIDGDMSITAENPDLGHQTVKVPLKSNGHKRAPLINLCYMEDILRATTADVIHVQCAEDNGMPLVFRPDGRNDYFSLVMPMRK
jgi:DNA polymerase-3 subunit beta